MTTTADTQTLSVVIPFYNEGENVDHLVEEPHRASPVREDPVRFSPCLHRVFAPLLTVFTLTFTGIG